MILILILILILIDGSESDFIRVCNQLCTERAGIQHKTPVLGNDDLPQTIMLNY